MSNLTEARNSRGAPTLKYLLEIVNICHRYIAMASLNSKNALFQNKILVKLSLEVSIVIFYLWMLN
jgi:hypothetical protein